MDKQGNNLVHYWNEVYEDDLLDYKDKEEKEPYGANKISGESVKKSYVGIHSSGLRDFLLKPD